VKTIAKCVGIEACDVVGQIDLSLEAIMQAQVCPPLAYIYIYVQYLYKVFSRSRSCLFLLSFLFFSSL
jgi:hypothetical protein